MKYLDEVVRSNIGLADKVYDSLKNSYLPLTIGGDHALAIGSIAGSSKFFGEDLAVVWVDAHGDINAPSESGSGLFYGMPVRVLLGESEGVFDQIIEKPMSPNQFINLGGRVLDQSERRFFEKHNIPVISVYDNKNLLDDITRAVEATGKRRLYIHLDLDVTEPSPLISTPVPEPEGLAAEDLLPLLQELDRRFHLTGLGIFEYKPCGKKSEILDSIIDFGLNF